MATPDRRAPYGVIFFQKIGIPAPEVNKFTKREEISG